MSLRGRAIARARAAADKAASRRRQTDPRGFRDTAREQQPPMVLGNAGGSPVIAAAQALLFGPKR